MSTIEAPRVSEKVSEVDEMLKGLVAPAQAKYDQLHAEEQELSARIREIKEAKTKLMMVIRVSQPKAPPPPQKKGHGRGKLGVSFGRIEIVQKFFLDHPGEEFYGSQVEEATGLPSSAIYPAIAYLLEHEVIAYVGPGGKTKNAKVYKAYPNGNGSH